MADRLTGLIEQAREELATVGRADAGKGRSTRTNPAKIEALSG